MKKVVLLLSFVYIFGNGNANPVIEPPVISEIYFGSGTFQIELYFEEFYEGLFYNLDELNLVSSSGSVEFNDGIGIDFEVVMVLDESDLKTSFNYNPLGDEIWIESDEGWTVGGDTFIYGNYSYSSVLAPTQDQSIAGYPLAIEEPSTIGSNPFSIVARGSLEGYVYDINNDPVPWLNVFNLATTNQSGYFHISELFCRIYSIWIKHDSNHVYSFSDTIYPYETSYVEIHLDTLLVGLPEYYNHPNPFVGLTAFHIQIPDEINFNTAYLSIHDISGKLIEQKEITSNDYSVRWSSSGLEPGIYIYNIVVDNKTFASKKMIIR